MATKKRLIDRNEIFPNGTFFANAEDPMKSLDELIARIWSIPTVDAVEVVRCKDCRLEGTEECPMVHRDPVFRNLYAETKPDDFCSYGERRPTP